MYHTKFDKLKVKEYYLNPLIGVGHHSNQQVDQHNHRHQHVNAEDYFEQILHPIGLSGFGDILYLVHLRLFGCRLTEDGEEEQLKRGNRMHAHWEPSQIHKNNKQHLAGHSAGRMKGKNNNR